MDELHDLITMTCEELEDQLSPEDLQEYNEWLNEIFKDEVGQQ